MQIFHSLFYLNVIFEKLNKFRFNWLYQLQVNHWLLIFVEIVCGQSNKQTKIFADNLINNFFDFLAVAIVSYRRRQLI